MLLLQEILVTSPWHGFTLVGGIVMAALISFVLVLLVAESYLTGWRPGHFWSWRFQRGIKKPLLPRRGATRTPLGPRSTVGA